MKLLRDLRVGDERLTGALPADALDFLRLLGGPTLLRLAGRDRSRCRVLCTLLHGNEPSGLRAVLRYLREGHVPAVETLIFIGAVKTALAEPAFGQRALPAARDLNRCWRPPWKGAEGSLARAVLEQIHAAHPECLVDIHNNSGHNPVYGVAFRVGHAELSLVSLFGERIVHTPIELGTLVEATVDSFPSVTIECGRAGDPAADEAAWRGLCRYLDWEVIDFAKPIVPIARFVAPVRVELREGVRLAFGECMDPNAELTISHDLDRHNFDELAAGTPLGWLRVGASWPFEALSPDGLDCSRKLLSVEDGVLRSKRPFVPIMMTADRRIALSDCLFYAVQPAGVEEGSLERVETCFAVLYRSASDVFKVHKPSVLRLGDEVLDLSSIDRRRARCLEEAHLDRFLSPDVELGVVAVTRGTDGEPRFGAEGEPLEGEPIDWALHMRRLPDVERADHRLAAGTLSDEHLRCVARQLAEFHERGRGPAGEGGAAALEQLRARVRIRIEAPTRPREAPLPEEVEKIEAWQLEFLDAQAERFLRRARSDAIRDGHCELSLEHVFLDDEGAVRILAGLEMSPRLRNADVAADVALLAGDLAARHRVDLAERFVADYARIADDFDLYPLLDFYSSLSATLRGKLDWLCANGDTLEPKRARATRERARRFFSLALSSPRRALLPAAVVALGGQVASGKSTVASHIARRIGAPVVGSDATRDFLLGARLNDDLHEARWEEAYTPGFGDQVYAEVLRRAGAVLESGRSVVIDGCFRSHEQRMRARSLAERFGLPFLFVETTVGEKVQLERLAERARRDAVPVDAWREIAEELRAKWEPTDELPANEHLRLDTALSLDHNTDSIEAVLPTWPANLTG